MLRTLLPLFAAVARAAIIPATSPNDPLHGTARGGVASEQAVCSDIGRNALVLGVRPSTPPSIHSNIKC